MSSQFPALFQPLTIRAFCSTSTRCSLYVQGIFSYS